MIVITGATGKIGSKTAAYLLTRGKKVKVIGRNADALQPLKNMGAEIAVGNMDNIDFLSKTFANAEAVLLMSPPDKDSPDFGAFHDVIGEVQVQAISNTGVKNVVFISSQGAHDIVHTGTPTTLKQFAETVLKPIFE